MLLEADRVLESGGGSSVSSTARPHPSSLSRSSSIGAAGHPVASRSKTADAQAVRPAVRLLPIRPQAAAGAYSSRLPDMAAHYDPSGRSTGVRAAILARALPPTA